MRRQAALASGSGWRRRWMMLWGVLVRAYVCETEWHAASHFKKTMLDPRFSILSHVLSPAVAVETRLHAGDHCCRLIRL